MSGAAGGGCEPEPVAAWVYLLRCGPAGSLYCGWTVDVARRLSQHRAGTGARYTRSRDPIELAAAMAMPDASAARREEARIKRLSREQKLELIARVGIDHRVAGAAGR